VVGGSLGARVLNQTLPAALALVPSAARPQVLHQTGAAEVDGVRAAYAGAGIDADVRPFVDDMAAALADCDLVVCRAGAITVSELCAAGVASVLVPLVVSTTVALAITCSDYHPRVRHTEVLWAQCQLVRYCLHSRRCRGNLVEEQNTCAVTRQKVRPRPVSNHCLSVWHGYAAHVRWIHLCKTQVNNTAPVFDVLRQQLAGLEHNLRLANARRATQKHRTLAGALIQVALNEDRGYV
jgi:hypothetical protein